jgi:MFS family permease
MPTPSPAPGNHPSALSSPAFVRILVAQATFGFGWCLYLLQPKFLTTSLGVGPQEVGAVGSLSGIASIATIGVLLSVIDRRGGRRRAFLAGSLVLSGASAAYAFVDRFGAAVYVLQACIASSYVLTFNSAMALVTDVAPRGRLGQAFGLQSAANLSMNAVSSLVAEAVADRFGWSVVFALGAVAGLAAFVVALRLPSAEEAPGEADARPERPPFVALSPVFMTSALMGAAFIALFTFHQPYAIAAGAERVSSFFVGFTAAALLMRLGFGGLGDRFGHRRAVLGSLALYALVPLAMTRLAPGYLWIYGAGMGLAHGVAYPTLTAFATEHAAPSTRGRIIAVYSGSFSAGTSLGAFAWGVVATEAGYSPLFFLASVVLLLAILTLSIGTAEHALPPPRPLSPS